MAQHEHVGEWALEHLAVQLLLPHSAGQVKFLTISSCLWSPQAPGSLSVAVTFSLLPFPGAWLSVQLRRGFIPTPGPGVPEERLQSLGYAMDLGSSPEEGRLSAQPQTRNLHFHFALSPTNYVAGPGVGLSIRKKTL